MYLEQIVTSAFPKLNPQTYGVINVQPQGKDWFVIADKASLNPVFESDDGKEAVAQANALSQAGDLAFWATWMDNERRCEVLYQGTLLTQSNDGLPLIPQSIVEETLATTAKPLISRDDIIRQEYDDLRQWEGFAGAMNLLDNTSFLACVEVPEEHPIKQEKDYVFVLVSKTRNLDVNKPSTVQIELLDPNKQVFSKESLYDLLHEYRADRINSWVLDGPDDYDEEDHFQFRYLKEKCPLYLSHHDPATQREHVFIHEGGAVMQALAATRPWMVEKDADGKALPLRISAISEGYDQPNEEGADKHARYLSSIVIHDKLTACAREAVIAQQAKIGITREQVMPDGRQFKQVANIRELDLEVMFDKEGPNVIGTREYLNYRIWVQGELVMDVHPGNAVQYNARTVSLSPTQPPLKYDVTAITDSQCGDLLNTALSDVQTDDDSPDWLLPERVKAFLSSSFVEEIRSDANALEEGRTRLVNGVFEEAEHSETASASNDFQPQH